MSDSSAVVLFEGGLDLVTPVQNSASGTLVGCLNYEVGPIKGYRRIDGYERYDGSMGGGVSNLYRCRIRALNPGWVYTVGDEIYRYGKLLAIITSVEDIPDDDDKIITYVPQSPGEPLSIAVVGYRIKHTFSPYLETSMLVTYPTEDTKDTAADHAEYVSDLRDAQALLRNSVEAAPRAIAGVYYGRDRAYYAVDTRTLNMLMASYVPEVGEYVRLGTEMYLVVSAEPTVIYLSQVDYGLPETTDLLLVDKAGNTLQTITGWDDVSSEGSKYASLYYTTDTRKYAAAKPILAVSYETGTEAFGDSVTLTDGDDEWKLNVLSYSVLEGSFSAGDATGIVYLYAGFGSTASAGFTGVFAGDVIIDNPGGAQIAETTGMTYPTWPGTLCLRDLQENDGKTFYQWGTYNFLATRGTDMVFNTTGCMRAGFAAYLDPGSVFYGNIVTNPDDEELDRPKYLSSHAGQRLVLGFASGSLQLSAVGEPLNFSGFEGAIEIGNGDGVTGLLEASGDSTLVFGPRSIRRLIGEGTDFAFRTVSSNSGALDYSACVVAGVPLYVNHNGVCALEQTAAYGDFRASALSGAVDPTFTPRIIQEASSIDRGGVVCAFPVRAKNQYRLFMGDGSVLSMAVTVDGAQPMLSSYNTPEGWLRVPFAYSSSVGDDGREYILCVWDADLAAIGQGESPSLPPVNQAYRLDHGWGFDGEVFSHYIDTAYMFNEHPQFLTVDKAIVYGMGYGEATIRLMVTGVEDDFLQQPESTVQDISMPRNPDIYYKELTRVFGEVDHANWGRALKLRFAGSKAPGSEEIEPPHLIQSVRMFVQTDGITE